MKLTFILFTFFFNFFNPFLIKAEEIIDSSNNRIRNPFTKEVPNKEKSEVKKIHIVKVGDTVTSISKLYSIRKELIIKLNDLKDENYIYIGQNLKISNANQNTFHIVQNGENLTEISIKYGLNLKDLIQINNIKDQNSLEVGSKLFLSENKNINQYPSPLIKEEEVNKTISKNNKIYGPLIIQQNKLEVIGNRKILNALNQNNKKIIISVKCDKKDLDVRTPGKKWRGWMTAKEEFEKNIINDFC